LHTIQSAMPDPGLRQFVRCFAQREISVQTSWLVQTSLASLEHTLAFYVGDQPVMDYVSGKRAFIPRIHLVGTQTRSPGCAYFTGYALAFGIFLKPFASWQLFRIPPAHFADQDFEAQEVFGPWIKDLWLRLAECETFGDRIRVANETLLPFAENASPATRTMATAQNLLRPEGGTRIQQVAHESCMSIRNYERKFVGEMGISPKLFGRLGRFQVALDIKRASGSSWLNVAHELGYFDQMHMVKDFRAFGGDAPSRLIQMCGDFQPWSIGVPRSLNHVTTVEIPNHSSMVR
jgi:AraC-like DNA-binding protein